MQPDFQLIQDDSWRNEIQPYLARVEQILVLDPDYEQTVRELWPAKIWPSGEAQLTEKQFVAFRAALFCTNIFSQAWAVSTLLNDLWKTGRLFAAPLNTRFIYECWGAIRYAQSALQEPDIQKATRLSDKFYLGVYKAEVRLPTGGLATEKGPNVMDYIRALKNDDCEAESIYSFLSSASHPNTLQNMYYTMMGPPLANWSNALFRQHAHELLEKLLCAHEKAMRGMQYVARNVLLEAAC